MLRNRAIMTGGLLAVTCGFLGACGSDTTQAACAPIDIPAFLLTVRDSLTGAVIDSQATAIATIPSSGYADTVVNVPSDPLMLGELPGTYDLSVKSPGYAAWLDSNIVIAAQDAGCHPVTQTLRANLQKLP
jgi:hypothetical protein